MQASVELDGNLTAEIVKAVVEELTPVIIEKVKSEYTIEKPMNKKEIATNVLGCSDNRQVDEYIEQGMPFFLVGTQKRFIPSEVRKWQIKNQRSY
ncbi:hypothetical protein [Lapidilactobacillus bayanensis]|uniref:hypothetical protein n=1 Tax=Lapidilactobacillus bayanensis TaxID=2485998 RepID=UPI000F77FD73|nr:hypothetical protein [Lapidilactobacillus bayanensis]